MEGVSKGRRGGTRAETRLVCKEVSHCNFARESRALRLVSFLAGGGWQFVPCD